MEDFSVSSPRRTLSLSKKRRALVSFDRDDKAPAFGDDKAPAFGVSGEHGLKPSEVYGFVGSITTVVATVVYLIWAYVPDSWLHSVGIVYYPSRYWALAVPAYVMVSIALAWLFYIGVNFLSTPPPTSFNIMFDEFSKEPSISAFTEEEDQPIEPISDIGINKINDLMFNCAQRNEK